MKEVVEARQQGCKEVKPRTLVEQSPEGCSASDGVVEAAVQEMEGIIRALLIAVEEYLGVEVDARERLIAFIPEYAAYLINRLRKGEDGKTAYERVKGKRPSVLGIEFGENVWYLKKKGKHLSKIRTRWGQGIFVGVRSKSNQVMISTRQGIVLSRSVRRLPIESRWGPDTLGWIQWAPWRLFKGHEGADGDVPEGVPAEEKHETTSVQGKTVFVQVQEKPPRDFQIPHQTTL